MSSTGLWTVVAGAAFAISAVIGARRASVPAGRAAAVALTNNALLRWDSPERFGMSAIATGLIAAVIIVSGLSCCGGRARRTARRALVGVLIVAGLAVIGAAVALAQAYGDPRDGEESVRAAGDALRDGDVDVAAEELERSSRLLGSASSALQRPWARPSLTVPILAQHVDALANLADEAASVTVQAATSVRQMGVDSLRVDRGAIDLAAIEVLEQPFTTTNAALRRLAEVFDDISSPWLLAPLGDRLAELATEVDELVVETERALGAVRLAPSMLGADGPRTYFVAFTTPAEARGLSGSVGSWAELRADGGRLEVAATGTTTDLIASMREDPPVLDGPADYLARYG